jgi:thiamine pyrophosphate-dependent acetolactate synthase large subunit-like protein
MGQGNRRASDLFVECLEAEGVKSVFGIPGEETLDLNQSLANSSVSFVPVRHEQGGAYMTDMYGRLTGRAGVCLGTLGPGAMNLVTAIGDAYLDRAPLVALTGQADLERMHKESHQFIDLIVVLGRVEQAKDDDGFPMPPPRVLWEIRKALGREDILISDVGLHELWIGRMFPAHEPKRS